MIFVHYSDGALEQTQVGQTPLHLAACAGEVAVVEALLEASACVSAVDKVNGSQPCQTWRVLTMIQTAVLPLKQHTKVSSSCAVSSNPAGGREDKLHCTKLLELKPRAVVLSASCLCMY